MSATADRPLPTAAAALRAALLTAAAQRLGLVVGEVDLRVTELLDDGPRTAGTGAVRGAWQPEPEGAGGDRGRRRSPASRH